MIVEDSLSVSHTCRRGNGTWLGFGTFESYLSKFCKPTKYSLHIEEVSIIWFNWIRQLARSLFYIYVVQYSKRPKEYTTDIWKLE